MELPPTAAGPETVLVVELVPFGPATLVPVDTGEEELIPLLPALVPGPATLPLLVLFPGALEVTTLPLLTTLS